MYYVIIVMQSYKCDLHLQITVTVETGGGVEMVEIQLQTHTVALSP